jgi:hypothetical protein
MSYTYEIKRYTLESIPDLVVGIDRFLHEERSEGVKNYWDRFDLDFNKMYKVLEAQADNDTQFFCNIVYKDNKPVGGLCATAIELIFSQDIVVQDLLLFFIKEYSNLRALKDLLDSYEAWGKSIGARHMSLSTSTGVRQEAFGKLLQRFNYKPIINGYIKEI